jgi:biopolymer transport protein ExbD
MRTPSSMTTRQADIGGSMTPMIDVVFQLLIYFLCTASFAMSEQILPATLPQLGSVAATPSKEIQELEVVRITLSQTDGGLHIQLNGNAVSNSADLRDRLRQLLALADLPAVLDVSPEVELGHVIAVYDSCLAAGMHQVHFSASQ